MITPPPHQIRPLTTINESITPQDDMQPAPIQVNPHAIPVSPHTPRPAQMMGFMDSVKSVLMNNFANFNGRASRSEYWWFVLFSGLVGFCLGLADGVILGVMDVPVDSVLWVISPMTTLFQLAILIPGLAVLVRRFHDLGKSGWWFFMLLIPCVGIILYIVWMATDGEAAANAYGDVPTNVVN